MCANRSMGRATDNPRSHTHDRFFNDPDQAAAVAQQLQLKAAHVLGQEWAELRNEEGGEERAEAQVRELLATMATTVQGMEQRLVMTIGLFDTEPALGCVALEEEATQAAVRALLAAAPTPTAQMWVAELFNKAASTEVGRLRLGSYVEDQSIVRLLQEESALPEVRVAAASAFTKLGLAAKALPAASQELATLFNIAADVLQRSTAAGAVERAVEVLSSLVTRTAFKQEITFGSGRCKACLPLVLALVPEREQQEGKGTANHFQKAWYGVSFILASLALSNDELRKEALREKGVAPEEYEQLQKVQEMQQVGKESDRIALINRSLIGRFASTHSTHRSNRPWLEQKLGEGPMTTPKTRQSTCKAGCGSWCASRALGPCVGWPPLRVRACYCRSRSPRRLYRSLRCRSSGATWSKTGVTPPAWKWPRRAGGSSKLSGPRHFTRLPRWVIH